MGIGALSKLRGTPVRHVTVVSSTSREEEEAERLLSTSQNSSAASSRLSTGRGNHTAQTTKSHVAVPTTQTVQPASSEISGSTSQDGGAQSATRYKEWEAESTRLNIEIQKLTSEKEQLQDHVVEVKGQFERLTSEKEQLQAHVAEVKGQFDHQQQESEKLTNELADLKQAMASGSDAHEIAKRQLLVSAGYLLMRWIVKRSKNK